MKEFYAEIWSCYGNLIGWYDSQEELDEIVKGLIEYGWTQGNGHDKCPEPWFVVDYPGQDEIETANE